VGSTPPESPGSQPSFEARWRERFEAFAESREDDAGIAGWSHSGLETRFRFFRRLWRGAPAGARWLDVGCGAGTYSRWLAEQSLAVVGVDYSEPTLQKARQRLPDAVALCAADAFQLPFADNTFDGVLCFGVLQAVSRTDGVAGELARVLLPGGTLWIDALNSDGLAARITEARRRRRGKDRHLRYESVGELGETLRNAGLETVRSHWLPIAPTALHAVQPLLDSRAVLATLSKVSTIGRLVSHSIVCEARKPAR
jgi:ubiquinone/menaquinone biosynthesis C-methylase UbiE